MRQYLTQGSLDSYNKLKSYGICINGWTEPGSHATSSACASPSSTGIHDLLGATLWKLWSIVGDAEAYMNWQGYWEWDDLRHSAIFIYYREMTGMIEQQKEVSSQGQVLPARELRAGGEKWESRASNPGSHFWQNWRMRDWSLEIFLDKALTVLLYASHSSKYIMIQQEIQTPLTYFHWILEI